MTPTPTGRLVRHAEALDLVLGRDFRADIRDVWASVTESERTARWFASWSGDARPGGTIRYRLLFEEGAPEDDLTILACEPPHRLEVATTDEFGRWHLELTLRSADEVTTLTLTHHDISVGERGEVGPGWEYYLDRLVAARDGSPVPDFDDYHPAQKDYFTALAESDA